MRVPKTPLLRKLRKALNLALYASKNDVSSRSEITDLLAQHQISRRKFVKQSAMAGIALGFSTMLNTAGCKEDKDILNGDKKIVIVGGGIAGLNAAYQLQKAGFASLVYEGSNRVGGRMFTAQNLMGEGLSTELGGEFIDSIHEDILALANELGLELLDTWSPSESNLTEAYFFDGQHYSVEQVIEAFISIAPQIEADYNALPELIDYQNTEAAAIDNLSIAAYLDQIGASGLIKKLLSVAYLTEYGLEIEEQTCLNLLYLISTDTSEGFDIFGESDERYKIVGGNQKITDQIANQLDSPVYTNHKLTAIKNFEQGYTLEFDAGGNLVEVYADYVVLTVPFTMLRLVDIQVSLPQVKRDAIDLLGYGMNAKVFLSYNERIWRNMNYTGEVFTDLPVQLAWEHTQLQNNNEGKGALTVYTGGQEAIGMINQSASYYVDLLEQIYPGSSSLYNGINDKFHWPTHLWTKASYACYKPGQITSFGGAEIEPVGNIFFAGEHCSTDFQGYMNGGAETGRRAAESIIEKLS